MICVCSLEEDPKVALEGKVTIKTMEDLYRILVVPGLKSIEVRKDFFDEHLSVHSLVELRHAIDMVNKKITLDVDYQGAQSFKELAEELSIQGSFDALYHFMMHKKKDVVQLMRELSTKYLGDAEEMIRKDNIISQQKLNILKKDKEIESLKKELEKISEHNQNLNRVYNTLVSRIQSNYQVKLRPQDMEGFEVPLGSYHKILYIKELSRVKYIDTLVSSIQEILRSNYRCPTRLIVFEAPYATKRIEYYPTCKIYTNITFEDVRSSDIMITGFDEDLMRDILVNADKDNFLIVLDRSGGNQNYLRGPVVEDYYTISDPSDLTGKEDIKRIISYDEPYLSIPHIRGYKELTERQMIGKYSSMEIVQEMITSLERRD